MRDLNHIRNWAPAGLSRRQAITHIAIATVTLALAACQHMTSGATKPTIIFGGKRHKDKGGEGGGG